LSITTAPAAAGREQGDIDAGRVETGQILDGVFPAGEIDGGTGRAGAGQDDQLADRKLALGQDRQHGFTNGASGADDSYSKGSAHGEWIPECAPQTRRQSKQQGLMF
jgi:hypothetical protein